MSVSCPRCGHATRQIKQDVIKLLEAGKRTGEIVRVLGCADSYVRQVRRDAFPHDTIRRLRARAYSERASAP